MKAVQIQEYGTSDVLKIHDIDTPQCKPDEVLIKVKAAGINPIDWKVRQGLYADAFSLNFPIILGWDMAGVVESVGNEVTNFKAGDEVYGLIDFPNAGNCYAEYLCAKADQIWLKPKNFNFEQAAACPLVALTAWQVLFDIGQLQPGQNVLIHAGSGGVGHVAIQLAKAKGAKVYTTCSKSKAPLAKELGADFVIDYQQANFEDELSEMDLVIDTVGPDIAKRSFAVLKNGGTLVSIASQITDDLQQLADAKQIKALWHIVHPSQAQLKDIAQLADDGLFKTFVSEVMPYSDVNQAHQKIEAGHTQGKIVLTF